MSTLLIDDRLYMLLFWMLMYYAAGVSLWNIIMECLDFNDWRHAENKKNIRPAPKRFYVRETSRSFVR